MAVVLVILGEGEANNLTHRMAVALVILSRYAKVYEFSLPSSFSRYAL